MSNEAHETVADIVAEIRRLNPETFLVSKWCRAPMPNKMRSYSDRIEEAYRRFYDKYKEHTNELNRQILVLKREKEMSDTYFCGYDPEEALVAQCSTCRFFKKKHSHCTLNDSLTNARYKCSGWEFKTNKECADEYKASHNHEVAELRAENASLMQRLEMCQKVNEQQEKEYLALKSENDRILAALKPVLECRVRSAMTAETEAGQSDYCANIIEKAQRIYNVGGESEVK